MSSNQTTNPKIIELLGSDAVYLLDHVNRTIPKEQLFAPNENHVDEIFVSSNRNNQVLRSMQALLGHGRLAGTGFCSIFPVDQGIEHSAASSFAPNPIYFDPENIIKLAIEGGCNAVASTFGVLGMLSRKYAHKIPFVVKINHNEFLSYPNSTDQTMFGSVKSAWSSADIHGFENGFIAAAFWLALINLCNDVFYFIKAENIRQASFKLWGFEQSSGIGRNNIFDEAIFIKTFYARYYSRLRSCRHTKLSNPFYKLLQGFKVNFSRAYLLFCSKQKFS